jgi:carbon monoxide dehydrogenase subunit G
MELENTFTVPAEADEVWRLLMDVPRVVPCMPGAELVETIGADAWKARMHVKMGPIALQFVADITREGTDEAARSTMLVAKAREAKGRGAATATIRSAVEPEAAATRVRLSTELQMQGAIAQYGRGVVSEVAGQLTERFASALAAELARTQPTQTEEDGEGGDVPTPARPKVEPVGGLGLLLRALLRPLGRLVGR